MIGRIQRLKAKKGFTMVELIVVIAIIAVLSAIIIPLALNYLSDAQRTSANSSASSIMKAYSTEVSNMQISGTVVKSCIFIYKFADGSITFEAGDYVSSPVAAVTDAFKNVMTKTFPDQTRGFAIVQILAADGQVRSTCAAFCANDVTFDVSATGNITADGVDVLKPATATSAAEGIKNDAGGLIIGISPQVIAGSGGAVTTASA